MTPEQFAKDRADFIKSCGKPPLHEVLGVVYDLDNVCDELLKENARLHDQLLSLNSIVCTAFDELRSNGRKPPIELAAKLEAQTRLIADSLAGDANDNLQSVINVGVQATRKAQAREAINARHDKEGGSRDRKAELLAIWATGKYSTKDICAQQENEALGVSQGTALKYLRNAPAPDPWAAKEQAKRNKK